MGWLVDELKWTADEDEIARGEFYSRQKGGQRGETKKGEDQARAQRGPKDESSEHQIEYIPQFTYKENNAQFTKASPTSDMDHAGIVS